MFEDSRNASPTLSPSFKTQSNHPHRLSFKCDDFRAGLRLLKRARRIALDDKLLSPSGEKEFESTNNLVEKTAVGGFDKTEERPNHLEAGSLRLDSIGSTSDLPRKIGHFELIEKLGQGSFGAVWKAKDTFLDRLVAIKLPHPMHLAGNDTSQILREARTAARIRHPNIVHVNEIGKEGETTYIVSDFVKGQTLTDWLRANHIDFNATARLVMTIASALHVAHRVGIVHRDIKPDNIMIDEFSQPRIMDFGLAKRVTDGMTVTVQGNVVGTPAYMSPEQARGDSHACDARTDIYALGVLLYQMLTGEIPFRGKFESILLQTIHDDPTRPKKLNRNIPADLETICLKCLEKEPSKRFASSQQLADELSRFLAGHPIVSRRISKMGRVIRWSQRNQLASCLLVLTMISLVAGTIVSASFAWQNHKSLRQIEHEKSLVLEKSRNLEKALVRAEFEAKRATDRLGYAKLGLYNAALAEVESTWKIDPRKAQQILIDQKRCPAECRDFAWDLYYSFCESSVERAIDLNREISQFAVSAKNSMIASSFGRSVFLTRANDRNTSIIPSDGHTDEVTDLAFSPNGSVLASASRNGTVHLWNCESGQLVRSILPKNGAVNSLAFSPDGSRLAIVVEGFIHRGGMGTWSVWDVETGEMVVGPKLKLAFEPTIIRFSPNGKRLAIAGRDRSILIFDSSDGEPVADIPKQEHGIRDFAYTSEDRLIIGLANQISAWDIDKMRFVFSKRVGSKNIMSLSVSSDGSRILVRSAYEDYLRVLDTASLKIQPVIWNKPGIPFFACFANDDKQVVTAVRSGRIEWKSIRSEFLGRRSKLGSRNTAPFDDAADGEQATKVSPDGRLIAYADSDSIVVRRVSDRTLIAQLSGPNRFGEFTWSPDGKTLAAGSLDGKLFVWDADGTRRAVRKAHFGACQSVAFSADGRTLATAGPGAVRLWDGQTVLPRLTLSTEDHTPKRVRFSPQGNQLFCISHDGSILCWEPNDRQDRPVAVFGSDNVVPNDLAISHNDNTLAATGDDGTLRTWDVPTGKLLRQTQPIAEKTTCVEFGAKDSVAFVGSTNREVIEVSLDDSFKSISRLKHNSCIRSISASNNRLVVALDWEGRLSSTLPFPMDRRDVGRVRHVSTAKSGSRLATGDQSGKVVVRDVGAKSMSFTIPPDKRKLAAIQLSADGSRLVVAYAGDAGEIDVWHINSGTRTKQFKTERAIRQVEICNRRKLLWTCEGHVLVIRDLETGKVRSNLVGGSYISRFVVCHNSARAIVAYGDGSILMWDVPSIRS